MGRILIGTCNWADHKGFYPPDLERPSRAKERLTYYAQHFPIVEVDTTFYGIPRPAVAQQWVERTPPNFIFNVKAYRTLTGHGTKEEPRRPANAEEWRDFLELLKPLREAGKLGAILYQFAPWVKYSIKNREAIIEVQERHPDDRLAVEFRHNSWYDETGVDATVDLLTELGITLVAVDAPQIGDATAPPALFVTSPQLAMVRFHGRNYRTWYKRTATSAERFDYVYKAADFMPWKERIAEIQDKVEEVHLMMNTNAGDQGPQNAGTLAAVLEQTLPG